MLQTISSIIVIFLQQNRDATITVLIAYMVFFIRQSQRIYDTIPGEVVLLQGTECCMSESVR